MAQKMLEGRWRSETGKGRKLVKSALISFHCGQLELNPIGASGGQCGTSVIPHKGWGTGVLIHQISLSVTEVHSCVQTWPAPSTYISSLNKSPYILGVDLSIRHHKHRTSDLQLLRIFGEKKTHTRACVHTRMLHNPNSNYQNPDE